MTEFSGREQKYTKSSADLAAAFSGGMIVLERVLTLKRLSVGAVLVLAMRLLLRSGTAGWGAGAGWASSSPSLRISMGESRTAGALGAASQSCACQSSSQFDTRLRECSKLLQGPERIASLTTRFACEARLAMGKSIRAPTCSRAPVGSCPERPAASQHKEADGQVIDPP